MGVGEDKEGRYGISSGWLPCLRGRREGVPGLFRIKQNGSTVYSHAEAVSPQFLSAVLQ